VSYRVESADHPLATALRLLRYPFSLAIRAREARATSRATYGLRVCRHLLEGLENYGTKEPTDTSSYSIEHILPQNERLRAEWRDMLGKDWKDTQKTWLDRLGNLTLTGYNSKYSDRPFEKKKTIPGGFAESSVRLNKFVREQPVWTEKEIKARTNFLAKRAVDIWPALSVDQSLIEAANRAELKAMAAKQDVSKVQMSTEAKALFEDLRKRLFEIDDDILELAEKDSVSYHSPNFFLEILPRRYSLGVLLPLDFTEIDDPSGLAQDATEWKFFTHAKHEAGVFVRVNDVESISSSIPLIRQAHAAANE
jgi:predicted transport protein